MRGSPLAYHGCAQALAAFVPRGTNTQLFGHPSTGWWQGRAHTANGWGKTKLQYSFSPAAPKRLMPSQYHVCRRRFASFSVHNGVAV